MEIKQCEHFATKVQAFLVEITPAQVREKIGFDPNVNEDETRGYGASWCFTINGIQCAVWYRGHHARACGTRDALVALFGDHVMWAD